MYPKLTLEDITPFLAILRSLKDNSEYLDDPKCPYTKEIKQHLAQMGIRSINPDKTVEDIASQDVETGVNSLLRELAELYSDLKSLDVDMRDADNKDKIKIVETKTKLLDKLVGMKREALNMKEMAEFQSKTMHFLDAVLEPHQRTQFVEFCGKDLEN